MTWSLSLSDKARKELDAVPSSDRARLQFKLWGLKNDPRPSGSVKLKGSPYYRVRQGDWRAIYSVDDGRLEVLVLRVLRRNERTYRD